MSTVGTLLIAHGVITLSAGQFSQIVVFALAGLSMSASYNLLLTAEALFARVAA